MKEKKKLTFGKNAQALLLYALPFMIFLALMLTLYVMRLDGHSLIRERETVILYIETVSRLCVCLALGTVLTDYAEKRSART